MEVESPKCSTMYFTGSRLYTHLPTVLNGTVLILTTRKGQEFYL